MTDYHPDTVLLLEDQPLIALDVEDLLESAGHPHVRHLVSCADAEGWLEANTPRFAILDPQLEDGFCTEVARILTERQVPFIVYSGDLEGAEEEGSPFQNGEWLFKPARPEDLVAAVRRNFAPR
jgi:DNA-binding response OmpR family regulator